MAAPTELYQQVTVLLTLAALTYFFSKRFHQPTIIGEIAIGVLIGPSVLGFLGIFQFDPTLIATFGSLGAIFLLFLIGLESDFRAIYTRRNFLVALGGVLAPLAIGFAAAWFLAPDSTIGALGNRFTMSIFVGATLTATSTAIAASVLMDLGLIREEIGQTIMGAAVVDDILGLLVLSISVGMAHGSVQALDVGILSMKAIAFIAVGIVVGLYFFGPLVVRLQREGLRLGVKHGGFVIAMAVAFFYSFVAETIGLSAIIGAFLAGTMFAAAPLKQDFAEGARYLEAVFTPIFFISLGLAVDVRAVWQTPDLFVFSVVLLVVAMVTKVAGCAIAAWAQGMSPVESLAIGWGMTPRGEVGLIVVLSALTAGIIQDNLFSVIVFVIILVSVVPAPLFKQALKAAEAERRTKAAPAPEAD